MAFENRIDTIRPDAPALAAYGKFPIGVTTRRLVHAQQFDIARAVAGAPLPRYDRALEVEVWYPALPGPTRADDGQYRVLVRDGRTTVTLHGKAVREAAPATASGPYPLVIVSHGYPGNRFLLSHLAENLASKGYVVASIDHADSTYADQAPLASTLLNRPLDQLFVLDAMARCNGGDALLAGLIDASSCGLIGYSMGGYGVLNAVGGGVTAASVDFPWSVPGGALAQRQAGNAQFAASIDPRIKAAVAFAPWGWNSGLWDAEGLAGIRIPLLFVAGSVDDVSGYAPGVRSIFEACVNAPRHLLTYEMANHNAGAPIPAPVETFAPVPHLPFVPAEHYIDPVWDTVRMNNIAQHFCTAFLGRHLRGDATMDGYLDLVEHSAAGHWSLQPDGTPAVDHSYWKGFAARTAVGLRLEHRSAAVQAQGAAHSTAGAH